MPPHDLVPTVEALPLPAPEWLLEALLLVTFFLHIVAMNFLVGGTLLALVAKAGRPSEVTRRLLTDLAGLLPSLVAATITLGIAPLLFVQALYGRFFYTSSVLIGWPWLLVLLLITCAYYSLYAVAFKRQAPASPTTGLLLGALVLLCAVGFTYSNNLTLASTPEAWGAMYAEDPSGWNLNLAEPTLVPRAMHFFVAAVALGGLLLAFVGMARWRRDPAYGRALIREGGKCFTHATLAQAVFGTWFLMSLPQEKMMLFLGGSATGTALLWGGIACAVVAVVLAWKAARRENSCRSMAIAAALAAVTVATMILARHVLRGAYLAPYVDPAGRTVAAQWSVIALFLALFAAGVALWILMLRRFVRVPSLADSRETSGGPPCEAPPLH